MTRANEFAIQKQIHKLCVSVFVSLDDSPVGFGRNTGLVSFVFAHRRMTRSFAKGSDIGLLKLSRLVPVRLPLFQKRCNAFPGSRSSPRGGHVGGGDA